MPRRSSCEGGRLRFRAAVPRVPRGAAAHDDAVLQPALRRARGRGPRALPGRARIRTAVRPLEPRGRLRTYILSYTTYTLSLHSKLQFYEIITSETIAYLELFCYLTYSKTFTAMHTYICDTDIRNLLEMSFKAQFL